MRKFKEHPNQDHFAEIISKIFSIGGGSFGSVQVSALTEFGIKIDTYDRKFMENSQSLGRLLNYAYLLKELRGIKLGELLDSIVDNNFENVTKIMKQAINHYALISEESIKRSMKSLENDKKEE